MKRIKTSSSKLKVGFKGIVYSVDEDVLGVEYSPETYNFTFRGGVLKGDVGVSEASGYNRDSVLIRHALPRLGSGVKINDVFVYHRMTDGEYDDRLIVQTTDGNFFNTKIFEDDIWHAMPYPYTTERVCGVSYNYEGKDVFLMSSKDIGLMIYDGETAEKVDGGPGFSSIAIHYERVFGVESGKENQVWFSSTLDPTNWTVSGDSAGYVTFQDECGDCIKVVSFLGYLYIFREHGIYRLTAYGDQEEFSLKKVFTDTGRIYKDTIVLAGDRILFYTDEGIHAFDGYNLAKLNVEIPKIFTPYTAVGAYLENKYYLACKIDTHEDYDVVRTNNCILEYDLKEKSLSVLAPIDAIRLTPMAVHHATDVLVVSGTGETHRLGMIDNKGKFFSENTVKKYRSPYGDMGTDRVKIVREILIDTDHPVTVIVTLDGQDYTYNFVGSSRGQKVFVDRAGHKVGFTLTTSSANAKVSSFIAKIDTL